MEARLRSIGHIRSNVLSKVVFMWANNVTELEIDRGQQQTKQIIKTKYPFIYHTKVTSENLGMNWSLWKNKITYDKAGVEIARLKTRYNIKDFLVKRVELSIQDKKVIQMFNDLQYNWAKGEGQINLPKPLPLNSTIYVSFKNVGCKKGENKWVEKINADTVESLGFPYGTLDLYHLETDRKKIYKEPEPDLDWMLRDYNFAKIILEQLKTHRWYITPRIQEIIDNNGKIVAPISIRTEGQMPSSKWEIIKDDEIRQSNGD